MVDTPHPATALSRGKSITLLYAVRDTRTGRYHVCQHAHAMLIIGHTVYIIPGQRGCIGKQRYDASSSRGSGRMHDHVGRPL